MAIHLQEGKDWCFYYNRTYGNLQLPQIVVTALHSISALLTDKLCSLAIMPFYFFLFFLLFCSKHFGLYTIKKKYYKITHRKIAESKYMLLQSFLITVFVFLWYPRKPSLLARNNSSLAGPLTHQGYDVVCCFFSNAAWMQQIQILDCSFLLSIPEKFYLKSAGTFSI